MNRPPKRANQLLTLLLKPVFLEEVLGDLEEKFEQNIRRKSPGKARWNYWYEVLQYLRPFAIKSFKNSKHVLMHHHNFIIGYRLMIKQKFFSAINIGGLALGMTVAILIGLWIHDELSFNEYHEKHERVVQVLRKNIYTKSVNSSHVSKLGPFLRDNYGNYFEEVAITFFRNYEELLTVDKNTFSEKGYFFEAAVSDILTLDLIDGTKSNLAKNEILLSESLAQKLFVDEVAVGQTLKFNADTPLLVKGVYRDQPLNTSFSDANFFVSMELVYNDENPRAWDNLNTRVYALLKEGVALEDASLAIRDVMQQQTAWATEMQLLLHPMSQWHLWSEFRDGSPVAGKRMQFVRLYAMIGLFVLLLACINFMNLNTARFQNRGREVGIRKTVGSLRSQLVGQFLTESMIYALIGFLISVVAVALLLPWFNGVSEKTISFPWLNPLFWLMSLGFVLLTGFVAGSYPAWALSSFKPLDALKGNIRPARSGIRIRQSLVVFQFVVSIVLIIGTIVIHNQIHYVKSRPVGYNQDRLMTIRGRSGVFFEKFEVLKRDLQQQGLVTAMGTANYPLTNTLGNNDVFSLEDRPIDFTFNTIFVTDDYGKATDWELVAGSDFSPEISDESGSIIVSELAVQRMGLEDPVGTTIYSSQDFNDRRSFTIIGVVKDMIKGSPYAQPVPLMVFNIAGPMPWAFLKISPNIEIGEAVVSIQEKFEAFMPGHPFMYKFVEDEYFTKFKAEEQIGSLANFFTVLAILVSCLGLFGLSAFVAENRTKEIGIRKILGASVIGIWRLISKDFAVLIAIACIVAIPIAAYFLDSWLSNYDYSIDLTWQVFAISIFLGFLITMITISYHALKVSYANPVDALRSE